MSVVAYSSAYWRQIGERAAVSFRLSLDRVFAFRDVEHHACREPTRVG